MVVEGYGERLCKYCVLGCKLEEEWTNVVYTGSFVDKLWVGDFE